MIVVTPDRMTEIMLATWEANTTHMLIGPPATAKTSIPKQVAEKKGVPWKVLNPVTSDPVDLRGYPQIKDGLTTWVRPDFLPVDGEGVFIIDEAGQGTRAMQAALMALVFTREVAGHKIGDGWRMVLTTNRVTDRAAVNAMPSPLKSRLMQWEITCSPSAWLKWAGREKLHPQVISFIIANEELLNTFDPEQDQQVYACPRTWHMLSNVLKVTGTDDDKLVHQIAGSLVGDGPAEMFAAFQTVKHLLPKMSAILDGTAPALDQPSAINAVTSYMKVAIVENPDAFREPFAKYIAQFPPEWAANAIGEMLTVDTDFTNAKELETWMNAHSEQLLRA